MKRLQGAYYLHKFSLDKRLVFYFQSGRTLSVQSLKAQKGNTQSHLLAEQGDLLQRLRRLLSPCVPLCTQPPCQIVLQFRLLEFQPSFF